MAATIPVSALRGDNVTLPLDVPWYRGPSLLQLLERLPTTQERTEGTLLQPVQYVARDDAAAGQSAQGAGHQPGAETGEGLAARGDVGDPARGALEQQIQKFHGVSPRASFGSRKLRSRAHKTH